MQLASLTRAEAEERAGLLTVTRYDVDVDLRGLIEGEVWHATSTIRFTCRRAGGSTFVDCGGAVERATLNGSPVDVSGIRDGRLLLPRLASDNTLVVSMAQPDTSSSAGILRTVDPTDGLVYVWTSLECDEARRLWACFDQPDLKAPHRFTVTAPESWTVTSNMRPESVGRPEAGARVWSFPDTPPLSPYVTVVNAGPFHEIREQRGDHSLGLYCRQSLVPYLERNARWLLDTTASGLQFFGERFGRPFPEAHYDQVFVPNMGGAMENWGCVTWTDAALHRSTPTHSQRANVAMILLHEMAHMWFGDLVTMKWWDDLWLNEAFASWASTWAAANATEFDESWAAFLMGRKLEAYRTDMGPASHAIRNDAPDVSSAMANFDAITYAKGQSVLHQLMAFVGEDAFTRGLQVYFARHAWGNTRLTDLMDAIGEAAGRDLSQWTTEWLDRSGTDTITVTGDAVLVDAPDDGHPRAHRIDVGRYTSDGSLLERLAVETRGRSTPLPGAPGDGWLLPNDTDLTFAAVRTGDESLRRMLALAGSLPDPTNRAVAVATGIDLLRKGELTGEEMLDCILGALETEKSPALLEPFLVHARDVAELWCPVERIELSLGRIAERATALSDDPDLRLPALHVLAASATTPDHDRVLDLAAEDDVDLAWRVAVRRAELGRHDPTRVEGLLARDPDPDATHRALAVTAALPEESAKAAVWKELFERRSVPAGMPTIQVAKAFWRPTQQELLRPWADRYLTEVAGLGGGMLSVLSLARGMHPVVGDEAFLARSAEIARRSDVEAPVRGILLTGADTLARMLRARG